MTRKDFEAIAAVLKAQKPAIAAGSYDSNWLPPDVYQWLSIVEAFAEMAAPRFFTTRFYAASGYETTEAMENNR